MNPFDLLADLDSGIDYQSVKATLERKPTSSLPRGKSTPPKPAHKATLFVHDNSNQKACCISVPSASLASPRCLSKFLLKKGFTLPQSSLLTVHEDCIPCNLHVLSMDSTASILPSKTLTADILLHLFIAHEGTSDSFLQSFANVHPECYRTLAECAEQPLINTPLGEQPVDFQTYLEAAFEASVRSNSILYNDCDKNNLKAEWCTWNTGLLWKSRSDDDLHSGYIFLFFKRSLSRVCKDRLAAFTTECARQAKPWTMNKPKPIADVKQWLNGAAVPPPPPADLVTSLIRNGADMKPIAVIKSTVEEEYAPCTPPLSEPPMGLLSDLASDCSCISHTTEAVSPTHHTASLSAIQLSLRSAPAASSPAPRSTDGSSKSGKSRRRRRRGHAGKSLLSDVSSPEEPSTPTKEGVQQVDSNIVELVSALQQACSTSSMQTCGWISSMSATASAPASNAWVL